MITKNLIANFLGKGWTALLSLLLIPCYIDFLGIESYGLIGLFTLLNTFIIIFDLGMGWTANREFARSMALKDGEIQIKNFAKTIELSFWWIGIFFGLMIFILAPFIAEHWIKAENLSVETIINSIYLMSAALIFQFVFSFYSSSLMGLEHHGLLNYLMAIMATIRYGGAVLALWLVSPTLHTFFAWQIISSFLQAILGHLFLWKKLPRGGGAAKFEVKHLRKIKKLSTNIAIINILILVLINLDKVILSKVVSLKLFGYYSLASSIAGGLFYLINPVFLTLFPRFSHLIALNHYERLKSAYHGGCQIAAIIIFPISLVIVFFSKEILFVWTGNLETVNNIYKIVNFLIIGTAINCLTSIPYALQLAHGWTRLILFQNLITVAIGAPLMFFGSKYFGGVGTAAVWIFFNLGFFLISIPILHRKFLQNEIFKWYIQDVIYPFLGAFSVISLAKIYLPVLTNVAIFVSSLVFIVLLAILASAVSTPLSRNWIRSKLRLENSLNNSGGNGIV